LKADDQEAYMRMVKESKNERLTMLLEETNKLLANLGAAVQRQKDAKDSDGIEALKDSEADSPELDASKNGTPQDLLPEEEMDIFDPNRSVETSDLLEGQRQYNSAIHAIQEKVMIKLYICIMLVLAFFVLFFLFENPLLSPFNPYCTLITGCNLNVEQGRCIIYKNSTMSYGTCAKLRSILLPSSEGIEPSLTVVSRSLQWPILLVLIFDLIKLLWLILMFLQFYYFSKINVDLMCRNNF